MSQIHKHSIPANIAERCLINPEQYKTKYQQSVTNPDAFWAEEGKILRAGVAAALLSCDGDPPEDLHPGQILDFPAGTVLPGQREGEPHGLAGLAALGQLLRAIGGIGGAVGQGQA